MKSKADAVTLPNISEKFPKPIVIFMLQKIMTEQKDKWQPGKQMTIFRVILNL